MYVQLHTWNVALEFYVCSFRLDDIRTLTKWFFLCVAGETDQDTYPLGVRGGGRRGKRTSQLLLALAWLRRKVEAYLPTNVTVLLKGGGGSNSQKLF